MNLRSVNSTRLAWIVLACLALSVTFFAPRLWLMRHYVPGSFQWDRAHTYLAQCEQPMRRDIEPAMQWRLLPPLVSHALHLPGNVPLALPWLGIIAATFYVGVLFRRRLDDWQFVAGGTLLFATTSAVLVPVGWLGINDAWVWLGLLAVAFGRAPWAAAVACLLCPWIDERFVIGFPLAWLVGRHESGLGWSWSAAREGLWLLPYAALRLWLSRQDQSASAATQQFVSTQLHSGLGLLPLAPLGWWMGLRAAWLAVAYAAWTTLPSRRLLGAATLGATLVLTLILASDLSRSVAVILPVVLLGCFEYVRRAPQHAPRVLLVLGVANLLIPTAHLTYVHFDPINPLPIEILRCLRPRMSLQQTAQRLGLGRLALALWHRPWARIRDSWRNGGPLAERETERQRQEMAAAAALLPPLPVRPGAPRATLHLLTGRRFWYQTVFCLHTFARQSEADVVAEIYDDGTFDDQIRAQLQRLGPGVKIHSAAAIRERLDALLPEREFPVLRERWRNYPNLRKLIDPHLGSTGWKLVIDSDLLFFRRPGFVLDWLAAPDRLLHAVDCEESYGYSRPLLTRLAGAPIPPLVNVGLCGLRSESLDWRELEAWCAELIAREKTHYFLEQALVAMLAARSQPCAVAPAQDYLTMPGRLEVLAPQAIMHHYVAESKRWYFRHGWRVAREAGPRP